MSAISAEKKDIYKVGAAVGGVYITDITQSWIKASEDEAWRNL